MSAQSGVGAGGSQAGAGFAGAPQGETQGGLTQGMSQGDIAALNKAGIQLSGPDTAVSPAEAAVTRPESMGGVGEGGQGRAVAVAGGSNAAKAPTQATPQEKYSKAAPTEPVPEIGNLFSIIAGMGGTPTMMAEGGELAPGATAITGEAGPEAVQAKPDGGATVTPLKAAESPPQSTLSKIGHTVGDIALGLGLGQKGAANVLAGRAEAAKTLAELGIKNPTLLRTSPNVVKAVDSMFGAGVSQQLVEQGDPNVQARMLAQMYGIPLAPGHEMVQLTDEMHKRGWGAVVTSKGELRFNQAARPTEQMDAIKALGDYNSVLDNLLGQGVKESVAAQAAAKRVLAVAPHAGYQPPKFITDLANAGTQQDIQAGIVGAKQAAVEQQKLRYAEPLGAATERGKRSARFNMPMSQDEIRAANEIVAQDVGGVAFGREMKDEDLINADEQGLMLKQQPSGTYIGIPKNKVRDDAGVMAPRELLTRRVAHKIAAKRTTQNENAQIVLEGLDAVDDTHALNLLTPAAQQGTGLGSAVAGAIKTEVAGQTSGRLGLFAARRSPDNQTRESAIALINLKTLATSVVKALGDVGAISEADKSVIYERFNRISGGIASREEASSQLQQLRSMMLHIAAGPQNLAPGSHDAEAMKQTVHEIVRGAVVANQAPPGFAPLPGTGAFWRLDADPPSQ